MILEVQEVRGQHVILEVDTELWETIVSACELRGEWFGAHGDGVVGSRLDGIGTIWMVGRRHGRVHTRVAWLTLTADACEWYAGLLRERIETALAQRAEDARRQLRSVVQEYHLIDDRGGEIVSTD